jgi:hypothetical protein
MKKNRRGLIVGGIALLTSGCIGSNSGSTEGCTYNVKTNFNFEYINSIKYTGEYIEQSNKTVFSITGEYQVEPKKIDKLSVSSEGSEVINSTEVSSESVKLRWTSGDSPPKSKNFEIIAEKNGEKASKSNISVTCGSY